MHVLRNRSTSWEALTPLEANLCENFGKESVASNSSSSGAEEKITKPDPNPASSKRACGPFQRKPETRMFVSRTTFTHAPELPRPVDFILDFFAGRTLAGLASNIGQDGFEFHCGLAALDFPREQVRDGAAL